MLGVLAIIANQIPTDGYHIKRRLLFPRNARNTNLLRLIVQDKNYLIISSLHVMSHYTGRANT